MTFSVLLLPEQKRTSRAGGGSASGCCASFSQTLSSTACSLRSACIRVRVFAACPVSNVNFWNHSLNPQPSNVPVVSIVSLTSFLKPNKSRFAQCLLCATSTSAAHTTNFQLLSFQVYTTLSSVKVLNSGWSFDDGRLFPR